jgi:hypothetical protein
MGSGVDERDGPDMPAEYKNVKLVKGKIRVMCRK